MDRACGPLFQVHACVHGARQDSLGGRRAAVHHQLHPQLASRLLDARDQPWRRLDRRPVGPRVRRLDLVESPGLLESWYRRLDVEVLRDLDDVGGCRLHDVDLRLCRLPAVDKQQLIDYSSVQDIVPVV